MENVLEKSGKFFRRSGKPAYRFQKRYLLGVGAFFFQSNQVTKTGTKLKTFSVPDVSLMQ